jgi:hypothetical protein
MRMEDADYELLSVAYLAYHPCRYSMQPLLRSLLCFFPIRLAVDHTPYLKILAFLLSALLTLQKDFTYNLLNFLSARR